MSSPASSSPTPCVDRAPVPCLEEGCPAKLLSCAWLATNHACELQFNALWEEALPPGHEQLAQELINKECPASCGACDAAGLRAAVAGPPAEWPTDVLRPPAYWPGNASSEAIASAIAAATAEGPLVITDALGSAFDPAAWERPALHARCAPAAGAPPPVPPWPTIAWTDPGARGERWAAMRFENGAGLGVRDLSELMGAQDDGRLRGVALFDSPANGTCGRVLLRRSGGEGGGGGDHGDHGGSGEGGGGSAPAVAGGLPAPRFFPRDYECALGGSGGEGLWRKGGQPWGDPDLFVSKAGTRTHVHVDSGCTRFWMLQLHGRKLWRVFPPDQAAHLHPAKATEGGKGAHYAADVLTADVALYPDLLQVSRGFEFALRPGELALIPEGWAHAVHNLDDTAALTYNFVDAASLGCHLAYLRPAAGRKLRRLFHDHLALGTPAPAAAAAAANEPALAYYAHMHEAHERGEPVAAPGPRVPPRVTVDDAHQSWETFFGSQGPYARGGAAALAAAGARLAAKLEALLSDPPPPGATADDDAEALLSALEAALVVGDSGGGVAAHDEL